jgi:hypothetical protein
VDDRRVQRQVFCPDQGLRTICERLEKELKVEPMKEPRVLMPRAAKAEVREGGENQGWQGSESRRNLKASRKRKAQKAKPCAPRSEKEAKEAKAAKAGEKARPAE